VLLMYAWIIDSTRGRRGEAADHVGEARALAEAGMAAWPEDQVRAAFYADFFHAAGGTVRATP
jgi:hypothetical protein